MGQPSCGNVQDNMPKGGRGSCRGAPRKGGLRPPMESGGERSRTARESTPGQSLRIDVFFFVEPNDHALNSLFGEVGCAWQSQLHFLAGGVKVSLRGSHTREFTVRVPLVRVLFHVDLEDGKTFVLFFPLLQAAAIEVELQTVGDVQRFA